jgi:SAM-dependent methyltransferase
VLARGGPARPYPPSVSGRGETYTHGHHDSVLRSHRWRTAENSAAYLLDRLRPGARVLDVGCGPGTISIDLARHVGPGTVLGIDREEQPLGEARTAAAEAGVANVSFEVGDVYELAFEDASFDVVHAHQVLQHLREPVAALAEMRRVCRPEGVVAARDADYAAMTWYPAEPALDRWLELYHEVCHANGAEPDAGRRLLAWARAAGFTEVQSSADAWCFATPEERVWWGGLWAERIGGSPLARQAVEYGLATQAELDELAAGWRRWAASDDGWFGVLHGEIVCRP